MPTVIAAIDAGSNAIRMTIAAVTPGAALTRLESERVPVRLGHRAFTRGEFDRATMEATVGAFARFATRFAHHGVQRYRAVGTSALRTAENRDLLLHRLFHETGLELEVIDAAEEARLVRTAVEAAFADRPQPGLMLDLGGGSLEVSWRTSKRWKSRTLAVGTVRLLETMGVSGALNEEETRAVDRSVRALLETLRSKIPRPLEGDVVATGGNPEALAGLFGERASGGMAVLDLARLRAELPALLRADVETRMARHGVSRDRAEVMAVAALVLAAAGDVLGFGRMLAPGVGVRDGVLLDLAASVEQPAGTEAQVRSLVAAARGFAHHLGHDTTHGERVRLLARALFDQVAPRFDLPVELAGVLEVAAVLHDVGEVVHRQAHHKHGEYLVRYGRIPGLEPPYRDMAAALVRTHRRSPPDKQRHETFAALPADRQAQVRRLAGLLRVADALDTDHRQRVEDLRVRLTDDTVELLLVLHPLAAERLVPPPRKHELFEQEFGRRLVIRAAEPDGCAST
jgi:exopolyphosphatase/guanosine-5'-triphosphate,3'-diphosphate pyrophosphatase